MPLVRRSRLFLEEPGRTVRMPRSPDDSAARAVPRGYSPSGSDNRTFQPIESRADFASIDAVTPISFVRGTMILATVAWALGEVLMRRSATADWWARVSWTIGIALALIHVVLAFHLVYAWDHEAAVAATARQAADRFGWGWRGGIYVNYVFLALWLADVGWWWLAPASRASRSPRIETARLAVFTFMFLNGAVVFASGTGRLVGVASVTVVLLASPALRDRHTDP
jgi:hypothetical protein